jgi:hypothetical protein
VGGRENPVVRDLGGVTMEVRILTRVELAPSELAKIAIQGYSFYCCVEGIT